MEDDLAELSEEGWQDELVNELSSKIADGSLTVNDLVTGQEFEAFVRDFVMAQRMSRRSRTEVLRERYVQKAVSAREDAGQLVKQWRQIGVRSGASTEEEVVNES